jgi:hypothetical protein
LGKGTSDDVQKIPENGYAFLFEHFGFAAYASFLWFCFSLFAYFRSKENYLNPLLLIARAVPVCILIVMHTSKTSQFIASKVNFALGKKNCLEKAAIAA